MSWHYSQALEAAYSAANSSAGAPSAPSSGTPTPAASSTPDKTTAPSPPSPSGTTSKPSTVTPGAAVLTWYLAAFPVRTFPPPAKALASKAPAPVCGTTWPESFARWDRATSSWKTTQCSLLADLDKFSETWPRWGMMRAGECSAQSMPAHLTNETGSGLWPTPRAQDRERLKAGLNRDSPGLGVVVRVPHLWPTITVCGNYNRKVLSPTSGDGLATAVKMWQTPVADDAVDQVRGKVNSRGEPKLSAQVKIFPTPTACMSKGSSPASLTRKSGRSRVNDRLDHNVMASHGGSLNPTWVEWLMGWPLGWTDCAASATDKFQQWSASHGITSHRPPSKPRARP